MTGQVFLVEGMVVDLDLGKSSEVVGHQHHRNIDVLQLPEMFLSIFFSFLLLFCWKEHRMYIPDILFVD